MRRLQSLRTVGEWEASSTGTYTGTEPFEDYVRSKHLSSTRALATNSCGRSHFFAPAGHGADALTCRNPAFPAFGSSAGRQKAASAPLPDFLRHMLEFGPSLRHAIQVRA